jgi:hypothetical protein
VATHDYVIANGTGAAVRSDLNGALAAIVSQNSNASAPATTYAYMTWADTTAGILKMRNGANSAWISLWELDGTFIATDISLSAGTAGAPSLYFTGDTNTGIYSPGTDQVAISTGGTARLTTTTTGITSALAVDVPLGAVGTPSITFTGDTNTGIYSPAADTLAFVEGGVEALRIDSSGRVGIGTASPGANLQVTASGSASNVFINSDIATSALASRIALGNSINTGRATFGLLGGGGEVAYLGSEGNFPLYFQTNGSERLRITATGNVGIGTTVPNAKLVVSNGGANGLEFYPEGTTDTNTIVSYNRATSLYKSLKFECSDYTFTNGTTNFAKIDSSGRLLVGTTSGSGKLTVSGNAIGTTVALTDAATVATDLSLANYYTLTLGGNRTLGAPTNQTAGQSGVIVITQDGTGSRTLAYNSVWKFPNGTVPTLTTTANAVDVLAYYVESGTRITARLLSDVK